MPTRRHRPINVSLRLAALLALLAAPLVGCGSGDPIAEARELQQAGRFAESLELLRAQLDERPDDPELQYLYGHALVWTGQLSLAQFALLKAMESRDWLVPAALELASARIATDNPEDAIAAATRALEVEPDHLEGLLLRARAQAMSRQGYEQALADLERVMELDPGNVEALTLRGVSLLGLGRLDEAEATLVELDETALEADLAPADAARFCAMRAVFAKEKGDAEAAERLFDACLEVHPADFLVVTEALAFFDAQGRLERGVEILRAALAESAAAVFRRSLAERLRHAGDVEEAERILREGTELENPLLAVESWVDLATHHHALGEAAEAASALERAVEIHGKRDPQLVFDFADALVMAGRHDEALELAREMEVSPHRDLVEGRVALEQGRAGVALEHFGAALRLWPDNGIARYYAAVAAERIGDFDRAIAEYRYSIRSDPNATDARVRLARLHEAEGQGRLALSVLQHDAARNPPGLDADLLAVRVVARFGAVQLLPALIGDLAMRDALGRAIAAAAQGLRARRDAAAAAEWILGIEQLDLGDPRNADALRVLVDCLGEVGRSGEALEASGSALAKHPEVAVFHAIHAAALRANAASVGQVRGEYSRALELDPDHASDALIGLAQLAEDAGDAAAALDLYARAAALEPEDASALRASAELLLAEGRREEAERQLGQALERDPYDGGTAVRLAELLLDRGADLDRALELAQRGARFGVGATADALESRILERRSGPAPASDAAVESTARNR